MTVYLVTGSRRHPDPGYVEDVISGWVTSQDTIISGGATGVDRIAEDLARRLGCTSSVFLPDWKLGAKAGPLRNRKMLDEVPSAVLAFPYGESKGTWDCINEAARRGIPVTVYGYPT
jgi:hypothetical protein